MSLTPPRAPGPPGVAPPPAAPPRLNVTINQGRVLGSGTLVVYNGDLVEFSLGELRFRVTFRDEDGTEPRIETRQEGPLAIALILVNFTSPIGGGMKATQVGTLGGVPIFAGLFVEGLGENARVLSYTFFEGGRR